MSGAEGVVLAWGAATHRGARRTLNEDRYLVTPSLFLVADGMGGHDAGEVASTTAVDVLGGLGARGPVGRDDVAQVLAAAHERVRAIATQPGRGAGTTVSGVVLTEVDGVPQWLVVNLGDSRTYLMTRGRLEQVSVDHSEVQEMVDAGMITRAEAMTHPRRHVVTRALGSLDAPQPDLWFVPVESHDRVLVCSDGLTSELTDERVAHVLRETPDAQAAADRLVAEALAAGGRDNITVVVVDAVALSQAPGGGLPGDDADEDTRPRAAAVGAGR
ncbi:PP2C family protein-serine/threonine phosphatase [Puerhibacterium puerhi]|uniref:PP2C family protein-serine/threonine phosphatase n=1 Tax=Puerhibacterium puerhi TaxID=2692623 RepID=UPI00135C4B8B|nr:protein phosphatase 2C domain-containing protein [Puerhibacterium puerhi]